MGLLSFPLPCCRFPFFLPSLFCTISYGFVLLSADLFLFQFDSSGVNGWVGNWLLTWLKVSSCCWFPLPNGQVRICVNLCICVYHSYNIIVFSMHIIYRNNSTAYGRDNWQHCWTEETSQVRCLQRSNPAILAFLFGVGVTRGADLLFSIRVHFSL
mgnify:CR=1 FL=1